MLKQEKILTLYKFLLFFKAAHSKRLFFPRLFKYKNKRKYARNLKKARKFVYLYLLGRFTMKKPRTKDALNWLSFLIKLNLKNKNLKRYILKPNTKTYLKLQKKIDIFYLFDNKLLTNKNKLLKTVSIFFKTYWRYFFYNYKLVDFNHIFFNYKRHLYFKKTKPQTFSLIFKKNNFFIIFYLYHNDRLKYIDCSDRFLNTNTNLKKITNFMYKRILNFFFITIKKRPFSRIKLILNMKRKFLRKKVKVKTFIYFLLLKKMFTLYKFLTANKNKFKLYVSFNSIFNMSHSLAQEKIKKKRRK